MLCTYHDCAEEQLDATDAPANDVFGLVAKHKSARHA